ncbi:MAG: osmoprotectant NAGGN system M42 family peptidase [Magnetococcales bacterium]|nr:osmoprotectant NAGGN system M42 family peptidase [Magnetococcales bacterium]
MSSLQPDIDYIKQILHTLMQIPSPSGMTDEIVKFVCKELDQLQMPYELTRRGAIRASLDGRSDFIRRAVAAHLDTLGAMVKSIQSDGRLGVVPIGFWSSRFAEGARVTIYTDQGKHRGTILPRKASGHVYNEEVDTQPTQWASVEVRIDEPCTTLEGVWALGIRVGDFISVDSQPEFLDNGFINGRHLDDKAGVACILAALKKIRDENLPVPVGCSILFTISEEVGVGASHVLHGNVAEMVSVDNGTIAPNQNTCEYGATLAMQDSSGPFDRHLTRFLISLCQEHAIEYSRDVFLHYRSDAASALEAGNDIRTALICFALDASHGYERTHIRSLQNVTQLLTAYMTSQPLFKSDENVFGSDSEFPIIANSLEQKPAGREG